MAYMRSSANEPTGVSQSVKAVAHRIIQQEELQIFIVFQNEPIQTFLLRLQA